MVKLEQHVYPYGKFYDECREVLPGEGHYDIIVYGNTKGVIKAIGSLEGFFISFNEITGKLLTRRDQMTEFEKKYNGNFIPSEKNMEKKE